jgi:hypothetical protein
MRRLRRKWSSATVLARRWVLPILERLVAAGGGGIDYSGVCSVATPSDYGSTQCLSRRLDRLLCVRIVFATRRTGSPAASTMKGSATDLAVATPRGAIRATLTPVHGVEYLFTSAALQWGESATQRGSAAGAGSPAAIGRRMSRRRAEDSRAGRLRRMRAASSDVSTPAKARVPHDVIGRDGPLAGQRATFAR